MSAPFEFKRFPWRTYGDDQLRWPGQTRKVNLAGSFALLLSLASCSFVDPVPAPTNKQAGAEPGEANGCPSAPEQMAGADTIIYETKDRPIRLFILRPPVHGGPHPAIIFFFGGGWRTGDINAFADQARAFQRLGYVAVLADYRVRCRDRTTPFAATKDAQRAYEWLRSHAAALQVDRARIVLAGGSAGGQLAAAAAMLAPLDQAPAALVLFNPAVDLVGPAPWYLKPFARLISPSTLPAATVPPTIIFHGQSDTRVPIGTVRAFCEALRRAGRSCRLWEYPGQGHGFYHSTKLNKHLGRSPYEDSLRKTVNFLDEIGVSRPRDNAQGKD